MGDGSKAGCSSYIIQHMKQGQLSYTIIRLVVFRNLIIHFLSLLHSINYRFSNFRSMKISFSIIPSISQENLAKLFQGVIQFSPGKLQSGGGSGLGLYSK